MVPQDLLQNRSLGTVPVCILWQCFPHDNTACSHMFDGCKKTKRNNRLSQALVLFVIDRVSLITNHRILCSPIRAKYKYVGTI